MTDIELVLEGIAPERQNDARRDLQGVLGAVFPSDFDGIKRITLARDFAQVVTETSLEIGGSGDLSYDPKYASGHQAVGKLLHKITAESYAAFILIDGRELAEWTAEHQVTAVCFVLHEAFHAELEQRAYKAFGQEYFENPHETVDPAKAWYRWMAQIWIDEFLVHRREVDVYPHVFQTREGTPSSARDHYCRWYGGDPLERTVDLFEALGDDLVNAVERYRRYQLPISDMWLVVRRTFRIALVSLSLVLALYPLNEPSEVTQRLAPTRCFRLLIGGEWARIKREFLAGALGVLQDDAKALDTVAAKVEWMLRRVGIRLYSNENEGLGMDVFEPALPWPIE